MSLKAPLLVLVLVAVTAAIAAGCGAASANLSQGSAAPASTPASNTTVPAGSAFDSPRAAVMAWLAAVNRKDRRAALAHFVPSAREMADWGTGPSQWPIFSAIRCKSEDKSTSEAHVYCAFHETAAPAVGQPDSWWSVELRRQHDGSWLIDNYGQG